MHYIDPHIPYVTDASIIAGFDPEYRGQYASAFGKSVAEQEAGREGRRRRGPYPAGLPKKNAVHRNSLPQDVVEHVRRLYAADVRSTDDQIRRLVEGLRARAGSDLLIVFTADHGESLGEHDYYWDHGDYVYNAASRIPLAILLPPGHEARGAGSYNDWVSITDIVPTVFDLIGLAMPGSMKEQMDGRSLAPAMRNQTLPARPVFVESGRSQFFRLIRGRSANTIAGRFRAVYSGDWKLIWAPGHSDASLSWQIYNLAADPHETVNLYASDHPEFENLRGLLLSWAEEGPAVEETAAPSETERKLLEALGYLDFESDE